MAKVFQPTRSMNPKHAAHPLLHYVLCNTKMTRDDVALALKKSRKALYDWEYQLTAYKDYMLDEVAKAADFDVNRIPPHIYARAQAAEEARLAADDKRVRARKKKAEETAHPTASNTPAPKPNPPTADNPRPAKPPHQYDPVQAAKPTMAPYEVRFIPSYIAIKNGHPFPRRSDGWYMINHLNVMEYSKTKEEATAKAEAKRAKDAADIADFL